MVEVVAGAEIKYDIAGAAATITIDRRSKRNALRLVTWRRLQGMIEIAESDPAIRLIIIRGADHNFGAGNDIKEFGALYGRPKAAEAFGRAMAATMRSVEDAMKPVVMAIEGCCYGASVALALAGDLRVSSDIARFAITPAKLGALYLRSDLHRLVSAVGLNLSKRMIYSAESIRAVDALDIGLVDAVYSADNFESELRRLVNDILLGSPFTLKKTKKMLREVGYGPTPLETDESMARFVEATQGHDFAEGTSAFLSKRMPIFNREQ